MQPTNHRLYFYQQQVLHLQLIGDLSRTLMRTQNCPIAEVGAGNASLLGTDRQGSVLFLDTGDHTKAFNYSAFGYDAVENEKESMLGFSQQSREPLTGFYLLGRGYRAYHSGISRFCSPDQYSPFDEGGKNAYIYCNDDPINLTDPTGKAGAPLFTFRVTDLPIVPDLPLQVIVQPDIPVRAAQQPGIAPDPVAAPIAINDRHPLPRSAPTPEPAMSPHPSRNNAISNQTARSYSQPSAFDPPSRTLRQRITRLLHPIVHMLRPSRSGLSRQVTNTPNAAQRLPSTVRMHESQRKYRQAQSRSTEWPRPSDHNREIRR